MLSGVFCFLSLPFFIGRKPFPGLNSPLPRVHGKFIPVLMEQETKRITCHHWARKQRSAGGASARSHGPHSRFRLVPGSPLMGTSHPFFPSSRRPEAHPWFFPLFPATTPQSSPSARATSKSSKCTLNLTIFSPTLLPLPPYSTAVFFVIDPLLLPYHTFSLKPPE